MRISDWSSDVCSSELLGREAKCRNSYFGQGNNESFHLSSGAYLQASGWPQVKCAPTRHQQAFGAQRMQCVRCRELPEMNPSDYPSNKHRTVYRAAQQD